MTQSAGTLSPASISTISPQTISSELISSSFPSRYTFAVGVVIFLSVSSVFSVLYSCTNPRTALRNTIRIIVTASHTSPSSTDITVAHRRIITIMSLNCPKNIFIAPADFLLSNTFLPSSLSRFSAFVLVSPSIIFSPFIFYFNNIPFSLYLFHTEGCGGRLESFKSAECGSF